jgi:Domain of unknown function (DUF3536)
VPMRVTASRVAGHIALLDLLDRRGPDAVVGGYEVRVEDHRYQDRGGLAQTTGRVTLVQRRTRRTHHLLYAAMHLGGMDVLGLHRPVRDVEADTALLDDLRSSFAQGTPLPTQLRRFPRIDGDEFDITEALPDSPGRLLETAAQTLAERFGAEFERLLGDHRSVFMALAAAGHPLPPELRVPAQAALSRRLEADLVALGHGFDRVTVRSAEATFDEAIELGITLDTPRVVAAADEAVERLVLRAAETGRADDAEAALQVLSLTRRHSIPLTTFAAQEVVYSALLRNGSIGPLAMLGRALGLAVGRLGIPR